jgi:hypothetical protein
MAEEAETSGVNEQEAAEPAEANQPESQETPQEPKENSKEYNWRRMEQKMSELERRNVELQQSLEERTQKKEEPEDEISQLEEDDLVTVRHMNKMAEIRARKIVEEELTKREQQKLPEITKSKYNDYDQVVTPDNLEELLKEDPDLEFDIKSSRNPYDRAYKEIRKSDFYRSRQKTAEESKAIEENSRKPVSSTSTGKPRPLSQANAYAKGDQSLWQEMNKFRGGAL